jgi:hypothetical protein
MLSFKEFVRLKNRKAKKAQSRPEPVATDSDAPTSGSAKMDELEPRIFLPDNTPTA